MRVGRRFSDLPAALQKLKGKMWVGSERWSLVEASLEYRQCAGYWSEHLSFIPEISTGYLLCARHCSRC